jgi:MFS family permease
MEEKQVTDRGGTATGEAAIPWAALAGIIATVTVFAVAQGLTYPLLSFILERQDVPPSLIGLSAAMTPLGFILSSPVIPPLVRRLGAGPVALACAGLGAVILALIGWKQELWLWFPLRFLLGFVVNPLYVISETWLITLTPPSRRGRVMGVYTALISGGFALGPLAPALVGTEGWPPFAIGIAALAACALCLALVLPGLPEFQGHDAGPSVFGFLGLAPLLLASVAIVAGAEQALLALAAVYGAAYGSPEAAVSAFLTAFIAGNIVLQVPLGLLAERFGARVMLVLCAALVVTGCALLPFACATVWQWPLAFVWGAALFGIYTMTLVELGNRYTGALLVAGNSAFAMFWGVGGIAVPPLAGGAMDLVGAQGLPLVVGLLFALLLGAWMTRVRGRFDSAGAPAA